MFLMASNLIGDRLRQVRESNEMSQHELSTLVMVNHDVDLDQSDISEIERGVRGVKDFELLAFSQVLKVTADWLLGVSNE